VRTLRLTGHDLTLEDLAAVAEKRVRVVLAPSARRALGASRRVVEGAIRRGERVYGLTTGFGKFADVAISPEEIETLQRNLIRSHSAGVGEPLPDGYVRAMMALRANALARGFSGIRAATVQTLLDMLAANVLPVIPRQGSVGASGDLAPLAHLALALIGEGEVRRRGRPMPAKKALAAARIRPVTLAAKRGWRSSTASR
jgi:histidine ammonia-lyase